jgi:hypothetical protein
VNVKLRHMHVEQAEEMLAHYFKGSDAPREADLDALGEA